MMIQAYHTTPEEGEFPIVWDNATEVSWQRVGPDDYVQEGDNTNFHGLVHGQRRHGFFGKSSMVRQVNWIDRVTGETHQLGSLGNVFILNDEGKTFTRV